MTPGETPASEPAPGHAAPFDRLRASQPAGDPSPPAAGSAPARSMPPASLSFLVASLAAQAQVALGRFENPVTKRTQVDLPTARHAIDLLEILEKKTKGNLEPQEIALMSHVLWDLRLAFVQASQKP